MSRLVELVDDDVHGVVRAVNLNPLDGGSVLVTGASVLIGIYVLASLRHWLRISGSACQVVAVMRSAPPIAFAGFLAGPGFSLHCGDLSDHDFVRTLPAA